MALGFLLDDNLPYLNSTVTSSTKIVPDRGFERQAAFKVRTAQFGDGYQQRIADGINSQKEQYSIAFTNRERIEIDAIAQTLENKKGVTSFTFTVPKTIDTSSPLDGTVDATELDIKVICSNFSQNYSHIDNYSLQADLLRVYEP